MDKKVTEEEYNKAKDEFEKVWIDTGVRTCAMTQEWNTYSNKLPISLEKVDLQKLFDSYQTEY